MSIDSLATVANTPSVQPSASTGTASTSAPRRDRDGDDDGPRAAGRSHGRHQFFDAVAQALNSVGLSLPAPENRKSEGANAGSNQQSAANPSDIRQALHSFMHTLFQTLRTQDSSNGGGSTGTDSDGDHDGSGSSATAVAKNYGNDVATKLQNLVQQLASPTGNSSQASALKTAFSNLVSALQQNGNSTNSTPPDKQPDLQTFLQNLLQNLQGNAASPLGGTVNTQA